MVRKSLFGCITAGLALVAASVTAYAAEPPVGSVTSLRSYNPDAGELPEGVAVDKRGRIYISLPFIGELRRFERDGTEHFVAQLPTGNGFGPLGLAVDAPGDVYVGVVTFDPATQGVYRVTPKGSVSRLPGTDGIGFANGLAFGDRGTLYVTDTIAGKVWRIPKGGVAREWLSSPLLQGDNSAPLPFPIGANGIAYRNNTVFVTNTELGSIVSVPVRPDGGTGAPSVLVQSPALGGADGVAVDVHGNLYVAVIAQSTVIRVAADGSSLPVLADGSDGLDYTSSVAFGTSHGDGSTLYAVNFSVGPFFSGDRTHGPRLLAIETGVQGLPQP